MDGFLGEIRLFAGFGGQKVPNGWLPCDGRSLPITGNEALYSLIGTIYGGTATSFNIPDFRALVPVGQGQGTNLTTRVLGQTGGTQTVTVTDATMPLHTHQANVTTVPATSPTPQTGMILGAVDANNRLYLKPATNPAATGINLAPTEVGTAGLNQAHDNMMPTTALTYMIAILGNYPQRQS